MSWRPSDMTSEYQQSLAIVRQCCHRRRSQPTELTILRSMEADLEWTIGYMATGDDRVYGRVSRCVPCDPHQLSRWIEDRQRYTPIYSGAEQARQDLLCVMDILPPRVQEAYLMKVGEGLSYSAIAEFLGVRVDTVKDYVREAKQRIADRTPPPCT